MQTTRVPTGMQWNRSDLFFLRDALARGMSMQDLAGCLGSPQEPARYPHQGAFKLSR